MNDQRNYLTNPGDELAFQRQVARSRVRQNAGAMALLTRVLAKRGYDQMAQKAGTGNPLVRTIEFPIPNC